MNICPNLEPGVRDGLPALVDTTARELFGVDVWFPLHDRTDLPPASRVLEADGLPAQSFERWIGSGWQLERHQGHRILASHQYRMDDTVRHPKGYEIGLLKVECWMQENGPRSSYLSSDPDVVLIDCQLHGTCAIPLRTFMQLGRRCWTCLAEENALRRRSPYLSEDSPRLAAQFSDLNIGLRPDMLRATSKVDVIWECPNCGNRWCIPVFLRARESRSNCPSCQSNVSRSELTLYLALGDLLDVEVRHGEGVTAHAASDVTIPEHRIIVEYDGDLHDSRTESDLRKDTLTHHLGWRTIRLRIDGLPPVAHPGTVSISAPVSGKLGAVMRPLLEQLRRWGVPVPASSMGADHRALTRDLQPRVAELIESMSHRRRDAGRKRAS